MTRKAPRTFSSIISSVGTPTPPASVVTAGFPLTRASSIDHDVVETESECHGSRLLVHGIVDSELVPVRIRAQRLVAVSGVHVDETVALVDDLRRDRLRDSL